MVNSKITNNIGAVKVSIKKNENSATATYNASKVYSDIAKDWAIKMNGAVSGIDYSAKYYANQSALIKDTVIEEAEKVMQASNQAQAGITAIKNEALEDITNEKASALGEISNLANGTKSEIETQGEQIISEATQKVEEASSILENCADIDFSNISGNAKVVIKENVSEELSAKADLDLSNVPASKGLLVESYVNGQSWYRIYSDGWCEQGGFVSGNSASTHVFAFLKPFKDTNYTLLCIVGGAAGNNSSLYYKHFGVPLTNATFSADDWMSWRYYACGYIN